MATFATNDKIYYKRLYALIYHPSWESKPLSKSYDFTIFLNTDIKKTTYVFKCNDNLINDHYALSLTIDELNSNMICFRSSKICEIICDYDVFDIK